MMRRGLLIGAAMLACGGPAAAAESDRCPVPYIAIAHPPGPQLQSLQGEIKRFIPDSSPCLDRKSDDGCSFVDAYGYLNSLSQRDPAGEEGTVKDRTLYTRVAERARNAKVLPYGIAWSDRAPDVVRKLKALKQSPTSGPAEDRRRYEVSVTGCWKHPLAEGFWTFFEFGPDGRLQKVEQGFQHY